MTGPEKDEIAQLREELSSEIRALRQAVEPAIRLTSALARISEITADVAQGLGRFVRFGVGIGAGMVTIILGLKALGVIS